MSEWIKHDNEVPKEHTPIKFKIPEGHINAGIGLGFYSSVMGYMDGERELVFLPGEIEGWKLWADQDPHKEWVKIEPGCVMPENGSYVDYYLANGERMMCFYRKGVSDSIFRRSSHWRYPHPDPIDV